VKARHHLGKPRRLERRPPVLAVLLAPARPGQRGLHGAHDAVPVAADPLLLLAAHAAIAAPSTVVLSVEGMTLGTCPLAVKRALEGLTGVQRAEVSFGDKEARVTFESTVVSVDQLIEAVNRGDFAPR
jgi:mercuric ion binding protein